MRCVSDEFNNQHSFEVKKWREIKKGFSHFANGDIGVAKITLCFQNKKSLIFRNIENGFGIGTTELTIMRVFKNTLINEYLLWFFKSEYFIVNGINSFSETVGQQINHKNYLRNCPFPLPLVDEQGRIITTIRELLPICDSLA